MNMLAMVAVAAALQGSFDGAWCSTKGEPVAMFTPDEYVDTNMGYVCKYGQTKPPNGQIFEAHTLNCSEITDLTQFTPLDVSVKFTKNAKGLMEWYMDKNGVTTPSRQLVKCEEPED